MAAGVSRYEQSRGRVIIAGLVVIGVVAGVMFVRRVDPVEVVATLLFLPVFLAFLIGGMRGGLLAGALASLAYLGLRWPAVQAVGAERFAGLITGRTFGFLAFGGIGGWASQQLKASITKLERVDHIDDETSLENSRSILGTIAKERARADRYVEIFSVVECRFRLIQMDGRARSALMQRLGAAVSEGSRSVDVAMHGRDGEVEIVVAVLPETGGDGAAVFASKLSSALGEVTGVEPTCQTISYPDQVAELDAFVTTLESIVAHEFPSPISAS